MTQDRSVSVRLVFRGRNLGAGFAAFAVERLARYALDGRVVRAGPTEVAVEAAGHPALVDMLEAGCSIGPLAAVVVDVERHDGPA